MGERGATGGAWGARDDASWWSNASGEIQNQQQLNEEIARSTASATHQLYTYKVAGGFSNNSGDTQAQNFDYRLMTSANSRDETPQQPWWFASGSDQQQPSSPTPQNQSSPDSEHSNQQGNGIQNIQEQQHNQIQQHSQLQQQLQQQQTLQQALQQQTQSLQQSIQQQTLQQMLQQQQQQQQQSQAQQQQQREQSVDQQNTQQSIQIQVSQAQAQALVQAQAVLQQQVAQTLQQQQQTLHEHIQAVQQQQIQAALQRQSANLQELQQQAQQQQQSLLNQQTTVTKTRMPRARAYNKPRGRMTAYAYFVQTCREEHKKKHPEENVVFAAFSKKCAERWNTMSEKEKLRFHEMAEQDRKRYDIEMQSYVPPKDVKVRGRKRQQPKDPNAPKRSLSAFFWFCNDERSKVKANNPEYTIGDIAKELGRRWAAVDAATKSKYEQLSEQDKARYDKEMTAYKKGPLALNLVQQQVQQIEEDVGEYEAEDEYK